MSSTVNKHRPTPSSFMWFRSLNKVFNFWLCLDLIIQYPFHKTLIFLKFIYLFFYFTASYCRGAGHDNLFCIKRQSVAPTFPHTPLMTRLFYHLTVIGLGEGRCVVSQILSLKHQCKTKEFLTDSTKLYIAKTYFINSLFETQISLIKQKKKTKRSQKIHYCD